MADANLPRAYFYVYVLFRHDTGQPFYVGKGCGKRWQAHRWDSRGNRKKWRLFEAARQAGREIPNVKVASNITEATAFKIEIALIATIGRGSKGPLLNRTDGGEGMSGYIISPEVAAKRAATNRGRVFGPEVRANMKAAQLALGYKCTPERIEAMRAFAIGRKHSDETREKIRSANIGRKFSDIHKANLSAAKKGCPGVKGMEGRTHSSEARAKMSVSRTGLKRSHETKQKIRESALRYVAKMNELGGLHRSPETRAKISASCTGRKHSAEAKAKMSAARIGRIHHSNILKDQT